MQHDHAPDNVFAIPSRVRLKPMHLNTGASAADSTVHDFTVMQYGKPVSMSKFKGKVRNAVFWRVGWTCIPVPALCLQLLRYSIVAVVQVCIIVNIASA